MKKLFKSKLIIFILIVFVLITSAAFAYSYLAEDIGFTPIDNDWEVDNTNDALNSLYDSIMSCDTTLADEEWNFSYYPAKHTFLVPCYGRYMLEVWGGQGGSYNTTYYGGYGGYSRGTTYLKRGDKLYIYTGGPGEFKSGTNVSLNGGYNGGGFARIKYSSTISTGSGGGATHISLIPELLSSLENNIDSILIVAGGGGGASYYASSNCGSGGSGGGYIGGNGTSKYKTGVGTGGSQTEPGYTSTYPTGGRGSFGAGAAANTSNNETFFASGGGGFYGGGMGTGNANGAGGGSGYIGNSHLTDKIMYCYGCTESTDPSTYTVSTTGSNPLKDSTNCPSGYSASPVSKCAKSGGGHVRITYLGNN